MRRKILACLLAFLMLACVLPPGLAAESPKATAVFEIGEADVGEVFTVTATVYDLTAWGVQFALRYDTQVIQPVDASGAPAQTFDDFGKLSVSWVSTMGTRLNAETGLIDFTYYIMPHTVTNERVNEDNDIVVGSEGMEIFTFRFKRLKEGDTGLQLATQEKGEPFRKACPDGVAARNVNGRVALEVIFKDAATGSTSSESYVPAAPTPGTPAAPKTVDSLLKEALVLKIGSHAAVVEGNAVAIYYGERSVTAYAHDNRTFVPIRFVGERMGAKVDWENDTQTVIITKDGHTVRMPVGSTTYTLDGQEKTLDVPAEFTPSTDGNSRTMVPIRFVSEALGYQVEWDQARNLVIVAPQTLSWDPAGELEGQAMNKAVTTLAMFGNFV